MTIVKGYKSRDGQHMPVRQRDDADIKQAHGISAMSVDEAVVRSTTAAEHDLTVAVFRALGDSVRLSIVRKLVREGRMLRNEEIVMCSSVHACSQPCMSYHFAKLVKAGVVLEQKRGTEKVYVLNVTGLYDMGIDVEKL